MGMSGWSSLVFYIFPLEGNQERTRGNLLTSNNFPALSPASTNGLQRKSLDQKYNRWVKTSRGDTLTMVFTMVGSKLNRIILCRFVHQFNSLNNRQHFGLRKYRPHQHIKSNGGYMHRNNGGLI